MSCGFLGFHTSCVRVRKQRSSCLESSLWKFILRRAYRRTLCMILIIWNSFVPKKSRESKHILFSPIRITCELKRMYLEWYCIFSQEHEFLIAQSREVPNQIASFLSSELSSLHSVSMLSTPGNANLWLNCMHVLFPIDLYTALISLTKKQKIGRASCRERVWHLV